MNSGTVNLTPRAQQVINVATEKARAEYRSEASPSDIAFGLIALGAGVAFNILEKSKIDVESLTQTMATNPDAESYKVLIPEASNEAHRLSHSYIGTEHILLALLNHPKNALTHTLRSPEPIQTPFVARSSRNSTRVSMPLPEPLPTYQGRTR